MRMGDKGFYFGLRHFNFSGAEFRRERERGKKGREKRGESILVKHIKPVTIKSGKHVDRNDSGRGSWKGGKICS